MKCVRFVCADPRFDKDIYIDAADIAPTVAGTQFVSQLDEINLQVLHHSFKIAEGLLLITTSMLYYVVVCYSYSHYTMGNRWTSPDFPRLTRSHEDAEHPPSSAPQVTWEPAQKMWSPSLGLCQTPARRVQRVQWSWDRKVGIYWDFLPQTNL